MKWQLQSGKTRGVEAKSDFGLIVFVSMLDVWLQNQANREHDYFWIPRLLSSFKAVMTKRCRRRLVGSAECFIKWIISLIPSSPKIRYVLKKIKACRSSHVLNPKWSKQCRTPWVPRRVWNDRYSWFICSPMMRRTDLVRRLSIVEQVDRSLLLDPDKPSV